MCFIRDSEIVPLTVCYLNLQALSCKYTHQPYSPPSLSTSLLPISFCRKEIHAHVLEDSSHPGQSPTKENDGDLLYGVLTVAQSGGSFSMVALEPEILYHL